MGGEDGPEEFTIDCHDLNLENVFVDEEDNSKIVRTPSLTTCTLFSC